MSFSFTWQGATLGANAFTGAQTPATNDGAALGSATLSWSDLFLASGAVINFANGDYTITHSSGALAFSAAANIVTITNTGTSGARTALLLNAVDSAPAGGNGTIILARATNTSAAQVDVGRIQLSLTTATAGAEFSNIRFSVNSGGALSERLFLNQSNLAPTTNDIIALGTAALSFADLFLASGALINFSNGNYTLTHSTGLLAASGPLVISSATAIPAGGTAGVGYRFSSTSNFGVFFGSGAPSLAAAKGSLYLRSDGGGVNDRAYINTDGSTAWTALVTAA